MYFAVIVLTDREMWKIEPVLASRKQGEKFRFGVWLGYKSPHSNLGISYMNGKALPFDILKNNLHAIDQRVVNPSLEPCKRS